MRRSLSRWVAIMLFGLCVVPIGAGCEDERCDRHADCAPPYLCVERRCWQALCDPENPTCPPDSFCRDGWCHAVEGDSGAERSTGDGDAESDDGDVGGDE